MNSKEIAAKIYIKTKNIRDTTEIILIINALSEKADASEVLENYLKIKKGEIKVIEVVSSFDLGEMKKEIEGKVRRLVEGGERGKGEVVFDYEIDIEVPDGISIKSGDNTIKLSISPA